MSKTYAPPTHKPKKKQKCNNNNTHRSLPPVRKKPDHLQPEEPQGITAIRSNNILTQEKQKMEKATETAQKKLGRLLEHAFAKKPRSSHPALCALGVRRIHRAVLRDHLIVREIVGIYPAISSPTRPVLASDGWLSSFGQYPPLFHALMCPPLGLRNAL
jgi:hypothetical protein